MKQYLTVNDVARIRGTDRIAAWRWLSRNAKPFVRRKGRFVVIALEDFKKINDPERVGRRLDDHDEQIRELTRRVDKHAEALSKGHLL